MDVLLLGAETTLGIELVQELRKHDDLALLALDSSQVDLLDREQLRELLPQHEVVLNLQEYADIDGAERDRKQAYRTNIAGVRNLAYQAARSQVRILQFSSAYVFDGCKEGPYSERDLPNPVNVYGTSKYVAEKELRAEGTDYLILRTHALYGKPRQQGHFLHALLQRLASNGETCHVIDNQLVGPTFTAHVARMIPQLLRKERTGILHMAPDDGCSWYEFARVALELIGEDPSRIRPAAWEQLGLDARRPPNMILDNHWLKSFTGDTIPEWRQGLKEAVS